MNQGIVQFRNEKMYIEDSLSQLLSCIGDSIFSVSVSFPMSSRVTSCYCSEDAAVVCEPLVYQTDRYILKGCSFTEFLEEICEYNDLSDLSKNDYDISEKNVWNNSLNTVAFIDVFKKFEHYAEISICSHAFDAPEMIIRYINGSEDTAVYSKENLISLLDSIISSK